MDTAETPEAKIVAVELTNGPCGARTVACFHAPSGGGEKIVDFLQRLAAELPSNAVMAGDTNVTDALWAERGVLEFNYLIARNFDYPT